MPKMQDFNILELEDADINATPSGGKVLLGITKDGKYVALLHEVTESELVSFAMAILATHTGAPVTKPTGH